MPFQSVVNVTQAPGVAGDFASANPRSVVPSIAGGWVAGPNGVTIGLFAWADTVTGTTLSNAGTGAPTGFIHRNQQALLTVYLTEFGMTIPAGMGVGGVYNGGDFFAKNAGASAATVGEKVFANNTTGTVSFAIAGATVAGSTETKWFAMSAGAVGELVKISNVANG
jgi:hypothetical protein